MMQLLPCAMLANGPPCTNAGTPSVVCTRFGMIASLEQRRHRAHRLMSARVTGVPSGR